MNDAYQFGYPQNCERCAVHTGCALSLRVAPYFKPGSTPRMMLIGQDPTIRKKPERVSQVLMLNEPHGQLSRWLKDLFGLENFETVTLYATNLVKCSFDTPPSNSSEGGLRFLKPYFECCHEHLEREILAFRPECVLTLGEPTHKLFVSKLDPPHTVPDTMQGAFTGHFIKAAMSGFEFDYSPCLHIQTFRVAEVYGESVRNFKKGFSSYFESRKSSAQ